MDAEVVKEFAEMQRKLNQVEQKLDAWVQSLHDENSEAIDLLIMAHLEGGEENVQQTDETV